MKANWFSDSVEVKPLLNQVKPWTSYADVPGSLSSELDNNPGTI